jgi:Protein of unknown function (DUF2917)
MDIELRSGAVTLARNQLIRIDHGRGAVIRCLDGLLWVTQHHDSKDYVLTAGENLRIHSHGPALIHAMKPASVRVEAPASDAGACRSRWRAFGLGAVSSAAG